MHIKMRKHFWYTFYMHIKLEQEQIDTYVTSLDWSTFISCSTKAYLFSWILNNVKVYGSGS